MILNFGVTLLILISIFVLGLLVYSKNPKNKTNKLFAILTVWIIVWIASNFLENEIPNLTLASLLLKIDFASASFLVYFWFLFCLNFPQPQKIISPFKNMLILTPAIVFAGLSFSNLIIQNIKFDTGGINFDFGKLYLFYVIYILGYMIIGGCGSLILKYRKSQGLQKTQILYVLLGLLLSGLTAVVINLFLQRILPVALFRIGIYGAIFLVGFTAYTIVKYRLMDIRVVLGIGAVYVFSFAMVIGLAFALVFLNNTLTNPFSFYLVGPVIALFTALVFRPIFRFYEKLASRYFYYTFYSYQKVITDLGRKLIEVLDLDKLTVLITNTLIETMKLDKTGVLLRDEKTGIYGIQKIIGFKEENGISLVKDNFLTQYLENTKKPLIYEELALEIKDVKMQEEKEKLKNLQQNMKIIEANVCLPLFLENKITGLILLGKKISQEPYSEQDIDLLIALSNQASIALENAKLYDQIQDLSLNLQQEVDEQTKEIKKAYGVEKQARKELERLNRAKDQFIMATQHHLRTPLTSMRGYLDLLLGGSYGKVPKKIGEVLKKFETSAKNEVKVINELLDISQFQLGKEVIRLEEDINIETIFKEIIQELQFETEQKKLFLKLEKSKDIPLIKADPQKLKVALFNIIDNAVKYTSQGGIIIRLEADNSKLRIIVKDTGIGIPKEELNTLFEKTFERGKEAAKLWGPGKGIGLFLTNQIIKSHKGRIWAESEGKGKGSTFFVELQWGQWRKNR